MRAGVELLEAAGLRADGLAGFFRRLNPITGGVPARLARQPSGLADRIAATDRPATGESAFDAEQWAAVKAVCTNSGSAVDGGDAVESGGDGSGGEGAGNSDSGGADSGGVSNSADRR